MPQNLANPQSFELINVNSFLLMNTEFKFDSTLIGFEMFASKAGTVALSVSDIFLTLLYYLFRW